MKPFLCTLTFVALTVLARAGVGETVPRTVSTTGTMTINVQPDTVVWNIAVHEEDPLLEKVKEAGHRNTTAVLQQIKALGIPAAEVQTGYLNIQKEYDFNQQQRNFKGWELFRTISFKQRDLKRFDEFLDGLLANAEVEVSYSLESSKYTDLRKDTRMKAVELARQKAQGMCEVLGAKLGKPLTISSTSPNEIPSSRQSVPWFASNSAYTPPHPEGPASATLAAGMIEVSETVNITFEIE